MKGTNIAWPLVSLCAQAIRPSAAALLLLWYAGITGAQPILATGSDAEVTDDGLHRVDPTVMSAAWVKPDLDLTRYTKILFMPASVQFRDVPDRHYNVRTSTDVSEFPISDATRAQLREAWGQRLYEDLAEVEPYEYDKGVGRDVLVVQGFLIDIISGVPPDIPGSSVSTIRDPWTVTIVLELRDSMSNDILARTIDRRRARGLINAAAVWGHTRTLVRSWSLLLCSRLEQLADLGGP